MAHAEDSQTRNTEPTNFPPRSLEEMKAWIESLGIKEGSPEYASMMQEAIRTWNAPGFQDMRDKEETRTKNITEEKYGEDF